MFKKYVFSFFLRFFLEKKDALLYTQYFNISFYDRILVKLPEEITQSAKLILIILYSFDDVLLAFKRKK